MRRIILRSSLGGFGALLLLFPPLSDGNSPQIAEYRDVAGQVGVDAVTVVRGVPRHDFLLASTGGPVALIDYDGDGWLDIYLLNGWAANGFPDDEGKPPHAHLYRNSGDGTFTDVTDITGTGLRGWAQGVCVGDYDNDSRPDIFVTFYGGSTLLHNTGNGFEKISPEMSGITSTANRWNTGCTFVDYDRDGYLDLFVANYVQYKYGLELYDADSANPDVSPILSGVAKFEGTTNLLYRNNGDGTFTDVSVKSRIAEAEPDASFTPVTVDYDNDGWPDIFLANDSMPNHLFHNNRAGAFDEMALFKGVAYNEDGRAMAGMGADAGDIDHDGFADLVQTNFSNQTNTLYKNMQGNIFLDETFASGLAGGIPYVKWGTHFYDFDADGWLDLFVATGAIYPPGVRREGPVMVDKSPSLLYRNAGGGRYEDVSERAGPGLALERTTRGSAVGDLFNDGRLEIVLNNINQPPVILRNVMPLTNHWLGVKLIGQETNRSGIGSRIKLTAGGLTQIREVRSGGSFCSQNDLRVYFGLGNSRIADSLEVHWLSGKVERFENIPGDRYITVEEGKGSTN